MGNGNCKQCKCNNCENGENNIGDNLLDNNSDIIKNDEYESFDNEIKNITFNEHNENKKVQVTKNLENEKNTTNNNQENITENKKEKMEIDNNNSLNNNDKFETINNINIINNDKEKKINEIENNLKINEAREISNEEDGEKIEFVNNIHIVNINKSNQTNNDMNDKKEEHNIIKEKINKTRNNIEEFDIINNDLVYITNKKNNIEDNNEYNNYSQNSHNNLKNFEIYKKNKNYERKIINNNYNKKINKTFDINNIIDINSIIPKNKIKLIKEDSIICNSILEKILKIPEKNKIVYNERFCVLTKKTFSYYKSKESFLNLTKPLLSIDLKNIIKVEQTILDDTSYYFGLICVINDDTKKYIDKINTFINTGENNDEEFLLGFRSKDKDLIIKWIVILNYFIENYE